MDEEIKHGYTKAKYERDIKLWESMYGKLKYNIYKISKPKWMLSSSVKKDDLD